MLMVDKMQKRQTTNKQRQNDITAERRAFQISFLQQRKLNYIFTINIALLFNLLNISTHSTTTIYPLISTRMETSAPFSLQRIKSDLKQIDQMAELLSKLEVPVDVNMLEMFQKLQELAGSRDFHPLYSNLYQFVLKLKWAREGCWDSGYIVPWMGLYSHIGINSHLMGVATHYGGSSSLNAKSPLIKSPPNPYGNGKRPVEMNREEWSQMLISSVAHYPANASLSLLSNNNSRLLSVLYPATTSTSAYPAPASAPAPATATSNNNNIGKRVGNKVVTSPSTATNKEALQPPQKKPRLSASSASSFIDGNNPLAIVHGPAGSVSLSQTELALLLAKNNQQPQHPANTKSGVLTMNSGLRPPPPPQQDPAAIKKPKARRNPNPNNRTKASAAAAASASANTNAAVAAANANALNTTTNLKGQAPAQVAAQPQVAPAADN